MTETGRFAPLTPARKSTKNPNRSNVVVPAMRTGPKRSFGRRCAHVWCTLLHLPQPILIVVGNDERIAFIVAQIANEGLVDDRVTAEVLARREQLRL